MDTLSAGYGAINRQPWVLLVPIAVDLFLLFGPRFSLSPLVDPVLLRVLLWVRRSMFLAPNADLSRDRQLLVWLEGQREALAQQAQHGNALTLVSRGPLAVPSVAQQLPSQGAFQIVTAGAEGLLLVVGCLAAGLILGAYFRAAIAQQVAHGRSNPLAAGRDIPRTIASSLAFLLAIAGSLVLLGIPLLGLIAFMALVAPVIAVLGLVVLLLALLLGAVYLSFALPAIFVRRTGPLRAIQQSVAITRRHLPATLGLVGLSLLIVGGMDQVWPRLAQLLQPPLGPALSVLGNAYIVSGLVAAGMIFYNDHLEAAPARATSAPPSALR